MILELLFLAFALGSEKAEQNAAALQVQRWNKDVDRQRKEFFAKQKKWGNDRFLFMGEVGSYDGKEYSWKDVLEKLDLIEEGYWFEHGTMKLPITDECMKERSMDGLQWKFVLCSVSDYVNYYLKLTDIEKHIAYRNSNGVHWKHSMYEDYIPDLRNLVYNGKVTIGVPFCAPDSEPCRVMTIQEARDFMNNKMEERFQKQR